MASAQRMTPCEAFAAVSQDGRMLAVNTDKEALEACWHPGPDKLAVRLARVTIAEGDGWQEIATCPKDRDTRFLVFNEGCIRVTNWHICYGSIGPLFDFVPVYEGLFGGGVATHWRPLPEPPGGEE